MRFPTKCSRCSEEVAKQGGGRVPGPAWFAVDLDNDLHYAGQCPNGHEHRFALQNQRYELLYQWGIFALHVGFYRESVSSCATALERFFQFTIKVFLTNAGVTDESIAKGWNDLKQTERQTGAFLMLYLAAFNRPFAPPDGCRSLQKLTELRNDVVHAGRIPSQEEAQTYAREVFEIVHSVRVELRANFEPSLRRVELSTGAAAAHKALEHVVGPPTRGDDGMYRGNTTTSMNMMLSDLDEGQSRTFEERLNFSMHHLAIWASCTFES